MDKVFGARGARGAQPVSRPHSKYSLALLTGLSALALDAGLSKAEARTISEAAVVTSAAAAAAIDATAVTSAAGAVDAAAAVDAVAAVDALDVVVTSQRREERAQKVPITITPISGEFIKQSGVIRVAQDVFTFVPNANAAATDGRDRPRWFIRGVGTNNTDANTVSPIGVYRDEVYIANVYAQAFPLFDLQRVEVLSGPQGTLWGKNTTGGAISYVSKAPSNHFDAYVKGTLGSDKERDLEGGVGGPIVDGLLAARFSFYKESEEGWYRNLFTGDVTPPRSTGYDLSNAKRVGDNDDFAWRGQLLFTPTKDLDILLSYHERNYKGDQTPSYILPDTYSAAVSNPVYNQGYTDPANPLPYGDIWAAGNGVEKIRNKGGLLRVNWNVGKLTVTSVSGLEYSRLERNSVGNTAIPLNNSVSHQLTPDRQFSEELRIASPQSDRLNWIIGGYYFRERNASDIWSGNLNVYTAPAAGRSYSDIRTLTDTESYAAFGSLTYNVTSKFKVTVGGRQNYETKTLRQAFTQGTGTVTFSDQANWWLPSSVASPLLTNSIDSREKSWSRFTYDVTPQYEITDKILAYFHYSYGFLSGGFDNRRNTATTPASYQIWEYQPENIRTYELGLKSSWWNGRLTANASLFYYDYPSIQVLVILPSTGTNTNSISTVGNGYSNAQGRVEGADFNIDARPTDALHLRAAVGLLDTKYTKYPIQSGINYPRLGLVNATIDPSGGEFTRAPKFTLALAADYTFELGQIGSLELGGDYHYLSHQYYNPTLEFDHTLEQKGYGLLNAHASWDILGKGKYRLTGTVLNLTNQEYLIHAIAPTNNGSSGRQGRPRSFLVSLTASF